MGKQVKEQLPKVRSGDDIVGEWRKKRLADICSLIKRGIAPAYVENGGVLVVNQRCIRDQRVLFSEARRTDPTKKRIPEDRLLQPLDVLVNSTGVGTLGRVGQIKELPEPATVDSHVTIVRADPKEVYPPYLGYALRGNQTAIESLAEGSTGQTELSRTRLQELLIPVAPYEEQRRIAHILGTLDDKIELNRKMNQTLEAIARAIFKSWLVDFDPVIDNALAAGKPIPDEFAEWAARRARLTHGKPSLPENIRRLFPDEFQDSELGPIPKGWEIVPLTRIASLQTRIIYPCKYPNVIWEHYSIPAFDESCQPKWECGNTIKSGKYVVPINCVLVSKLNPQFPRIWLPNITDPSLAICSTEFMPFVPTREHWRPYLYELLKSPLVQGEIKARASGSTGSRQRVKPKEIAKIQIITPASKVINAFF